MRMKVVDQLHIGSVRPDTMGKGTEFEISDDLGRSLEKRGLATEVKAEAPPENKAERPPKNKAEQPPAGKATKP